MHLKTEKIKSQKGSIAVYVTVVLFSMLIILSAIFLTSNSAIKSQIATAIKVKESYQADNSKAADIYEELTTSKEPSQKVFTFNYTGSLQTFTAPADGVYKLQVWGAQGGSYDTTFAIGGKRRIF